MSTLPINDVLPEIRRHFTDVGRVVVSAATGSGKTTVLPLALLAEPWATGRILLLEPRRVAARAAARHMARTLGEQVGDTVGLTTGDGRTVSKRTRLEVITDGVLPRRLLGDADLTGVSCVLFDEFHERSVSSDLGLAMTLDVADLRPDDDPLRIGILSATLNAHHVATAIGAEVVTSEGRTHPVEIEYLPPPPDTPIAAAVARAVLTEIGRGRGDILAFVPGMAEIRRVTAALEGRVDAVVLPLHGALGAEAQDRALAPNPHRKVIVATDVAETSLTIDGVTTVIDSGHRRASVFSPRTGMDRLETVRISRASADQRAGRAGRTRPGRAVRLWAASERRPDVDPPAITTSDPAPILLIATAWSGSLGGMRLLDVPPPAATEAASDLLGLLGLVDADRRLTELGRRAVELPTHPRLATMLLGATTPVERATAAAVAALLGERDVFSGERLPVDLALRVDVLGDGSPPPGTRIDRGRLQRVRTEQRRLARMIGADTSSDSDGVGAALARAFPDRIATRRSVAGTFVTRQGRGVRIAAEDPLATERFVVVADLNDRGRDADAWLAAALDAGAVAAMPTTTHRRVERHRGHVEVVEEERLGAIVVTSRPAAPTPDEERWGVLEGIRTDGIGSLGPGAAFRSLQQRVGMLRAHLGDRWPAIDDATLAETVHEWLEPFLDRTRRSPPLLDALRSHTARHIGWELVREVDRLAPTHLTIPSGRSVRLDYDDAGGLPVLAVKLQEMFGAHTGPSIADGRIPVVVQLLSPAGRPVQVTSDLAGFWERGYHDVRKELRGRYPRHPWPEDPLTAVPTRRAKPR